MSPANKGSDSVGHSLLTRTSTYDGTDSSPATHSLVHMCKHIVLHTHASRDREVRWDESPPPPPPPDYREALISFKLWKKRALKTCSDQHWLSTFRSFTAWLLNLNTHRQPCIIVASYQTEDREACKESKILVGRCLFKSHICRRANTHACTHSLNVIFNWSKEKKNSWMQVRSGTISARGLHHVKCVCCFEPKELAV